MAEEKKALQKQQPRSQMVAINNAIEARLPVLQEMGVEAQQSRRLMYGALGVVANDPKLMQCTPVSVARAVVQAALLDLDVAFGLGEAYLVPYANSCTLMPGYRGWQRKAREAGYNIEAETVYACDDFEFSLAPLMLRHTPCLMGDRGEPVGIYAYATPINKPRNIVKAVWVTMDESDRAKSLSKSPAWKSWPERMRRKLAVARLCRDLAGINDGLRSLAQVDAAAESGVAVYDARLDSLEDIQLAEAPAPEPLPEGRQPVSKAKRKKKEATPTEEPAEVVEPEVAEMQPPPAEEW